MAFTNITKDSGWLDKGNTEFQVLDKLTNVVPRTATQSGITMMNGFISTNAEISVTRLGALKIVRVTGAIKGKSVDAGTFTQVLSVPKSYLTGTFISDFNTVHHNGMGGVVSVNLDAATGILGVTTIDAVHDDLLWACDITIIFQENQ